MQEESEKISLIEDIVLDIGAFIIHMFVTIIKPFFLFGLLIYDKLFKK